MQRALLCFNIYGCQAVRHKLKKGVKTQKMHSKKGHGRHLKATCHFISVSRQAIIS